MMLLSAFTFAALGACQSPPPAPLAPVDELAELQGLPPGTFYIGGSVIRIEGPEPACSAGFRYRMPHVELSTETADYYTLLFVPATREGPSDYPMPTVPTPLPQGEDCLFFLFPP